jgi:hypothetical protein
MRGRLCFSSAVRLMVMPFEGGFERRDGVNDGGLLGRSDV